jgi:hypothetical protein
LRERKVAGLEKSYLPSIVILPSVSAQLSYEITVITYSKNTILIKNNNIFLAPATVGLTELKVLYHHHQYPPT